MNESNSEIVNTWIEKADHDLGSPGNRIPKIAWLTLSFEILSEKVDIKPEIFDKAILLNGFSVEIRYPNQIIHLTENELKSAILIADEFRQLAALIIRMNNM